MNVWEIAILKIIACGNGTADTQEIYSNLESGRYLKMKANDLRTTQYGGRPAYRHQVRSHLSNLVEAGDLVRISRDIYSLTAKGKKRIR